MPGRFLICVILAATLLGTATGQEYPTKPIRVVTSGVGGGTDFTSRLLAQGLSELLGQQVIVENRASSVITGEFVAKAAPDGYTLLTAWAVYAIHRSLIFELPMMGFRFIVLRLASSIMFPPLAGIICALALNVVSIS